ncbi:hypothetical protein L21_1171 [Methanoculleus chikugoensis]|uniref:Uncharacterized protein n=1 Tax=Methanoculleus chikugoensis TaxID=118126 RepID=A0A1M4MK83_9EURY|nr:DUF4388 domain-containing protein [Methanoculleus chikugoensis]SCL75276.1 hypothetical protein L21_1171 [Methanoculleus chikugoensis]
MQLPRGRFHRLIKSTTTRALTNEINAERFTGICTIVLRSESATLVLNDGEVVLAEYGGMKGQHALETVLDGEEDEVAAELNLLTPEQVRLALEFNPLFAIETPGRSGRPSAGKGAPGRAAPATPKSADAASSSRRRPEPAAEVHHIPMPGVKPAQEKAEAPQSGGDEINELVQNMEEMDVEQLVGSFKLNCRDMLKKIHLDHLIKDKET